MRAHGAGFFALETPLLPLDTLRWWSVGLQAPTALDDPAALDAALTRDRARLRARLQRLIRQPAVREAIYLAAPALDEAIDAWLAGSKTHRASVEPVLTRLISSLVGPPAPFGSRSATGVGTMGKTTSLVVGRLDECRRRTTLDADYLARVADALTRDAELAPSVEYRPNTTLRLTAGRWQYVEARRHAAGRSYRLVAVDNTRALEATLARAASGATRQALASALVARTVSAAEAAQFVEALVEHQLLISTLVGNVTDAAPLAALTATLAAAKPSHPSATLLDGVLRELEAMDRDGVGVDPARYRRLSAQLDSIVPVEGARLFHLDLIRSSASPTLGAEVVDEIARGADILQRLTPAGDRDPLAPFRAAFLQRYGTRTVPLAEAVDEEAGLGSTLEGALTRDASPLIADLLLAPQPSPQTVWSHRDSALLQHVVGALASGRTQVALEPRDVEALTNVEARPLPGAFAAIATLVAGDAKALARGDVRILLHAVHGPSGANLLGHLCHADAALTQHVRAHLQDEEAREPDVVFAEIVHLPQGPDATLARRPSLRQHEIPYLGFASRDAQPIPVDDLTVTVAGDRVVLRSTRLSRRVVPRLTAAHVSWDGAPALYRLLCLLQNDGSTLHRAWSWGALTSLPFLPRLTHGRLVLARATWRVSRSEVQTLTATQGADQYRAVQAWRHERKLPRWIVVEHDTQPLTIDLDNVLSCESLVAALSPREEATIVELYPDPDELCANGPQGAFTHEIIVPFVLPDAPPRRDETPMPASVAARITSTRVAKRVNVARVYPPGSRWVSDRLHGGAGTLDRLLTDTIAAVSRKLEASRAIDRWHFVRHHDADPHVRWYLHAPVRRRAAVTGAIERAVTPLVAKGLVQRFAFDTYEPDVDRSGGHDGVDLAEQVAWADSLAVVDVLRALRDESDGGGETRWRAGLVGADRLLEDLGLALDARLAVVQGVRDGLLRELNAGSVDDRLASRYQRVEEELRLMLDPSSDRRGLPNELAIVFDRRARRLRTIATRLHRLLARGSITVDLGPWAAHQVLQHIGRVFRADVQLHTLVLADFLARAYHLRPAEK